MPQWSIRATRGRCSIICSASGWNCAPSSPPTITPITSAGSPNCSRGVPCPVYGPRGEPIPTLSHPVSEGDQVEIPQLGLRFSVLDIPGHTRAHIAYYGANSLFCGDTLFACGCGRLFEGTAQQMVDSLAKLAALPDATLVYCGHEYTLANIDFARAVEPNNADLKARAASEAEKRERGQPTLPSTIGREKKTNPFLRCMQPAVIASAEQVPRDSRKRSGAGVRRPPNVEKCLLRYYFSMLFLDRTGSRG